MEPTYRDSQQAFEDAIASGFLSDEKGSDRYAGKWMYMHTDEQGDAFKNINYRNYIHTGSGSSDSELGAQRR